MSNQVIKTSEFDASKITLSELKPFGKKGAQQVYVNYNGGPLLIQSGRAMQVPFGLSNSKDFNKEDAGRADEPAQYFINLSFRGSDSDASIKLFKEVMERIDDLMIQEGVKNRVKWFKDNGLDYNGVKKYKYTPIVKVSKDKETGEDSTFPPNMKIKLRQSQAGEFLTEFYDLKKTQYDLNEYPVETLLGKGVQISAVIQCVNVWFAGGKYGVSWSAKQIAVHKLQEKMSGFAIDLGDEDADAEDAKMIEDDEAFAAARPAVSKPSVIASLLPKAASSSKSDAAPVAVAVPASKSEAVSSMEDAFDDAAPEDHEPIPAPIAKKTVVKKTVVKK